MRKILTLLFTLILVSNLGNSQNVNPSKGIKDKREITYAFIHATIINSDGQRYDDGVLLIKNNKIIAIGKGIAIPADASIQDLSGKYIYPSFIDLSTEYGMPSKKPSSSQSRGPQYESLNEGPYFWNEAIHPETTAHQVFTVDEKAASELRKLGFGAVLTGSKDGIARGTNCLVALGDGTANENIIEANASANFSFDKGSSKQEYPSSLMGSIALLRQTYYDAAWYKTPVDKDQNNSLAALNASQGLPQLMEVSSYQSLFRAAKIAKEFNIKYIIKGAGDEYKRLDEIKQEGVQLIIPLIFPEAIDFIDPYDVANVSLVRMKEWEMAPANAALLDRNAIPFALTTNNSSGQKDFLKNLFVAQQFGLKSESAIKALTSQPAKMLNLDRKLGKLEAGLLANFIICNQEIKDKDFKVLENWVAGKRYITSESLSSNMKGSYTLSLDTLKGLKLKISGDVANPTLQVYQDTVALKSSSSQKELLTSIKFTSRGNDYLLNGGYTSTSTPSFKGDALLPDGRWVKWNAVLNSDSIPIASKDSKQLPDTSRGPVLYPDNGYGFAELPSAHAVLIKNITVWTNEKEGILLNTDVLIQNGKVAKIGKSLDGSGIANLETIDGSNMHLTAGIIDEHSHIAIAEGVNESGQSVTSEVSIGDVVDCDDVNIYRQLAGGVTSSQLLHGSANAIGGQSAIVKLRWGSIPEKMKCESAPPFIKFALGENVKQSNWGDENIIRYPQSRMGVEQVFIDAFTRAREYEKSFASGSSSKSKTAIAPRRDLELDALVEILNSKRFITCHSYQQGEINMLMHVADSFGFKVNTFTHILEGYKVADKMKRHGVGASSFADWWGYKYEVIEAIPHNGAILHNVGVTTAFNSDDAEMARRLNQEAAKAVKYGNVSEEEALKFVTLNPAKLLHIDDKVGSVKVGKDADLVIWNDKPLSVYAHPMKTFVDGICYFDIDRDKAQREIILKEKLRIAKKMKAAKENGASASKPYVRLFELNDCSSLEHLPK
jgi:imidazolonepropionase-like amidohydrolase